MNILPGSRKIRVNSIKLSKPNLYNLTTVINAEVPAATIALAKAVADMPDDDLSPKEWAKQLASDLCNVRH